MYSNGIILLNWVLSSKSNLLSENIICSMVNKNNLGVLGLIAMYWTSI